MEYIKIKRSLEKYTVRNIPDNVLMVNASGETVINESSPNYYYGTIPEYKITDDGFFVLDSFGQKITNTIDINIFLKQNLDDMGFFNDLEFVPKKPIPQPPNNFNPFIHGRIAGGPVDFYYTPPITVTGTTDDSHLNYVKSKRVDSVGNPIYQQGLNVAKNKDYFDGVISNTAQYTIYKKNAEIGNISGTGIQFKTYTNDIVRKRNFLGEIETWGYTEWSSPNTGWNDTNIDLYANVKKEELLGIVFKPEITDDVFINRGVVDIFERNAILSEIKSTNDLDNLRGGYLVSE